MRFLTKNAPETESVMLKTKLVYLVSAVRAELIAGWNFSAASRTELFTLWCSLSLWLCVCLLSVLLWNRACILLEKCVDAANNKKNKCYPEQYIHECVETAIQLAHT